MRLQAGDYVNFKKPRDGKTVEEEKGLLYRVAGFTQAGFMYNEPLAVIMSIIPKSCSSILIVEANRLRKLSMAEATAMLV